MIRTTRNKQRNNSQDGSFASESSSFALDPEMYLKQFCVQQLDTHINQLGETNELKNEFETLKEEISKAPGTVIFTKKASFTLKKLTKKASTNRMILNKNNEVIEILNECERATPPPAEEACGFLGCRII